MAAFIRVFDLCYSPPLVADHSAATFSGMLSAGTDQKTFSLIKLRVCAEHR